MEYNHSVSRGIFSKIDHIMGHKKVSTNFKGFEIIYTMSSGHTKNKLEINEITKKSSQLGLL